MKDIRPGSKLTTSFGHDVDPVKGGYRFHRAIDRAGGDKLVYCPLDAKRAVIERNLTDYGTLVRLFYDGFEIRVAHSKTFLPEFLAMVSCESPIPEGQAIAQEGMEGKVTGPHSHIELVVTGGVRSALVDHHLQDAGFTIGRRYTAQDLGGYSGHAQWMSNFGCYALGPHECWCWDRRTGNNAIWIDPLVIGL